MAGKGSAPRPIPDRERFERNWSRIQWGTIPEDAAELRRKAGTRTEKVTVPESNETP